MEKVEIKLSQFGFEDSEKRRYFIHESGKIEALVKWNNGDTKLVVKIASINNGYPVIWVVKGKSGKRTALYVRELVAMAFHGYDKSSQYIINLDFNKLNNSAENIKVVDSIDEWRAHYKPTFSKMKGVCRRNNIPNSKLTEKSVLKIKELLKSRVSKISDIAKKFSISKGQVYRIKRGDNWSHLKV